MTEFLAALAVFLAAHVLPARIALRARLTGQFGERGYLAGYSLLSLALLAWLVSAALRAPVVPLWPTYPWHYRFALALMVPASMLLIGGAASANPLSIGFGGGGYDPARPGVVGITRHPLLWAFALWALAHMPANGALVPLILFGGFALFALGGMAIVDRRRRRQLGEAWAALAAPTAILPFAAWPRSAAARRWRLGPAVATVAGGLGCYALLLWLHPRLIGPDPAALLR